MQNVVSIENYKKVKRKSLKKTSKKVGNAGEAAALAKFISLGYEVYTPFGNSGSADLIVDIDGELYKVQVKTSASYNGDYTEFILLKGSGYIRDGEKLISRHARYERGEVDIFVLYDIQTERLFILPGTCTKTSINIRYTKSKNGSSKNINYADDYDIEKGIKKLVRRRSWCSGSL